MIDPKELVPDMEIINDEIQDLFVKHKLTKAQGVLVLTQCAGAISAEIILCSKRGD